MGLPEHWEQVRVVKALKRAREIFCAVPNGGYRVRHEAVKLKAEGVMAGVPDLLIFSVPDGANFVGVALEMKKATGKKSDLRKAQKEWLARLQACGWVALVGYGGKDAIEKLRGLGYDL